MSGPASDVWGDAQDWLDRLDNDGPDNDAGGTTQLAQPQGPHLPQAVGAAEVDPGPPTSSDSAAHADPDIPAAGPPDPAMTDPASGDDPIDLDAAELDPAASDDHPDQPGVDDPAEDGAPTGASQTAGDDPSQTSASQTSAHPPRYNKAIVGGFIVATVIATLAVSGALLAMRAGPHTADGDHSSRPSTRLSVISAPTTSAVAPGGGQDSPIPYTATAVGCLPGSTTAQSVAGSDPTQAWVCVHGGTVGQYLVLELGRTTVITAVSITPGWVGANTSGADQWLQHRVLTRVQWSFNDTPPTVVSQETRSVHGEAPQPIPGRGVLASRIIVLIQDTGRAPADAPSTASTPPRPGGLFGDVLGTPAPASAPPSTAAAPSMPADQTDPADNTFAVSAVKIFGHPPQ